LYYFPHIDHVLVNKDYYNRYHDWCEKSTVGRIFETRKWTDLRNRRQMPEIGSRTRGWTRRRRPAAFLNDAGLIHLTHSTCPVCGRLAVCLTPASTRPISGGCSSAVTVGAHVFIDRSVSTSYSERIALFRSARPY